MINRAVPMIHVPDVAATARWYVAVGFTLEATHEDCGETLWAHLTCGPSALMLSAGGQPSAAHRREVDIYVYVDDIEAAFARVAPIAESVEPIHDTEYGMREFIVRDPNRFWLTFGQPVAARTTEQPPKNVTLRLLDQPDDAIRKAIVDPLVAYNHSRTGRNDYRPLVLAIEDSDGQVIGGLWGRTAYGWLFVELLFVPESLRGRGIGSDLMSRAEFEALARGCHAAWLDTFEFQARGFYERIGYACFGELKDYPVGSARYFMTKTLTPPLFGVSNL